MSIKRQDYLDALATLRAGHKVELQGEDGQRTPLAVDVYRNDLAVGEGRGIQIPSVGHTIEDATLVFSERVHTDESELSWELDETARAQIEHAAKTLGDLCEKYRAPCQTVVVVGETERGYKAEGYSKGRTGNAMIDTLVRARKGGGATDGLLEALRRLGG